MKTEMIREAKKCFKNAQTFVFPEDKTIDEINSVLFELKDQHKIMVTTVAGLVLVWEE